MSLDKTKVGNFFISNYPQYSFWKPDNVPGILERLDKSPESDVPLGIYIHLPFCRKRCHFCYFRVYTDKNSAEIKAYIAAVIQELKIYSSKKFVGGRLPKFVYFGGGTPSYLSGEQFSTLVSEMKAIFPWNEVEEVTVECEPGTLTEEKIKRFKDLGVTRLSLGIENFDDAILEKNNRAHRSKEINRAYNFAREVGFEQINIDLIAGMMGENDGNWRDVINKSIELCPDSITIYQMEIPFNTSIYKKMKEQGNDFAPVADWQTKRRWVDEAFVSFEEAKYDIIDAYTVVKNAEQTRFVYREKLWTGADMIGLGVSAFGHINGSHIQNEKDYEPYLKKIKNDELPINRGLEIDKEEKMIREFILLMKTGRVDVTYINEKFDVDICNYFKDALEMLTEKSFLIENGEDGNITLNRQGLLQVDVLLHEFFLPQHRGARYT